MEVLLEHRSQPGPASMRAIPTNVIRLTVLLAATVFAPRRSPAQVPVSLGVRVTFPAGVPTVSWTAQRGATEYTVERWMESNPSCCRVRSDRLGSPSWADAGLAQAGTY